jgi:hypothetical protein
MNSKCCVAGMLDNLWFINRYWLVVSTNPSEKYDFVIWDDDIPKIWKNKKMFQTTNQIIYDLYMDIMSIQYIISILDSQRADAQEWGVDQNTGSCTHKT